MDKRITFSKLAEIIGDLKVKEISLNELRRLIIMKIGSTERTIQSCLKIMGETNLIKDIGNTKFKVLHKKLTT